MAAVRLLKGLAWAALGLAAIHVAVGTGMALIGNTEGWLGGLMYAVLYATPLVLIAIALRSSSTSWHGAAGWAALLLGAYYTLIVAGNWSGYSTETAIFAVSITVPTVALDLAIFWATVLHRAERPTVSPPSGRAGRLTRSGG
jgi:hypothetical protein